MNVSLNNTTILVLFIIILIYYIAFTVYQFRLISKAQKNAEDCIYELAVEKQKMHAVFESINICPIVINLSNSTIEFDKNYSYCLRFNQIALTQSINDFIKNFDSKTVREFNKLMETCKRKEESEIKCQLITKDERNKAWIAINAKVSNNIIDMNSCVLRGYAMNISENKQKEIKYKNILNYDQLTNLPNRHYLLKLMEKRFSDYAKNNIKSAGVFIDIDNFKLINDVLGHQAGDIYLKLIANIMDEEKCENSYVARLSGDEFFIFIEEYQDKMEVEDFVKRMLRLISTSAKLEFLQFSYIQASAGIAFYDYTYDEIQELDIEDLIQHADTAMFRAKELGKNQFVIYNEEMTDTVVENYEVLKDLRIGYEKKEFKLLYQPIVNILEGKVDTVEALIRWEHPYKGVISPAKFIPVAEISGEIYKIGLYVIREALEQLISWQNTPLQNMKISINMSPTQLLRSEVVEQIKFLFENYRINPNQIKFEITENIMMDKSGVEISNLERLKELGFEFALDDFGAEYSSLNMLNNMDFNTFKIDKHFIQTYEVGMASKEIFIMVRRIEEKYNKSIIVEGVETKDQLQYLQSLNFTYVQGFYFSKPVEADKINSNYLKRISDKCEI